MQFRGPPLKGKYENLCLLLCNSGANLSGSKSLGFLKIFGFLCSPKKQMYKLDPAGTVPKPENKIKILAFVLLIKIEINSNGLSSLGFSHQTLGTSFFRGLLV